MVLGVGSCNVARPATTGAAAPSAATSSAVATAAAAAPTAAATTSAALSSCGCGSEVSSLAACCGEGRTVAELFWESACSNSGCWTEALGNDVLSGGWLVGSRKIAF